MAFQMVVCLKLRQQLNSPFKMKNETEAIRSNCIAEIEHKIEPLFLLLKTLVYRLGIKTVQNNRSRLHRFEFSKPVNYSNPLFTQNEIAGIVMKYWYGIFILSLFFLSESFLYWLTAPLFVPGSSEIVKILVAFFLALLGVCCIDYGLAQHFKYRDLKPNHIENTEKSNRIKEQNDKRILGYFLIVLAFAGILFSGLARIYFLENISTSGLSDTKKTSVHEASKWASLLTLVITIATAILLGMIKRDQSKLAERYKVMKYWEKALRRRNEYSRKLIESAGKIVTETEKSIEQHFQLVLDLKRIFKMDQEFDSKYEQLNQEYLDVKSKPGFTLNDHVYRKFSHIQSAHEELFRYGIYNASEIKAKLSYAAEVQKITEEYLNEHSNAIYHQDNAKGLERVSMNGKQNEQHLQTT